MMEESAFKPAVVVPSPFPARLAEGGGPLYQRDVPWGVCRLEMPTWPRWGSARLLRAAVVDAMAKALGPLYHSDWCGRDPETGEQTMRRSQIHYRTNGYRPAIYAWGERAHDHIAALAHVLRAVRVVADQERDGYRICEVAGAEIETGIAPIGLDRRRVYHYRFVNPFFPGDRQWGRRPRQPGPARDWHRLDCLHGALYSLLSTGPISLEQIEGWERSSHLIRVSSDGLCDQRVEWSRPLRGLDTQRVGIGGAFSTNLLLLPGMAFGHHAAEGYGVVEQIGVTNLADSGRAA